MKAITCRANPQLTNFIFLWNLRKFK